MQLVYLWVEKYKNIKNRGFNFSPEFECKYDEDSNKLTIDKYENYQPIFPSNINVTAIVGENGSGKSSLVKKLLLIVKQIKSQEEKEDIKKSKYILIVKDNNKGLSLTTNLNIANENIINKYNIPIKNNNQLYFKLINFDVKLMSMQTDIYENPLSFFNKTGIDFSPILIYDKNNIRYELITRLFSILVNQEKLISNFRNIFYPNMIHLDIYLYRIDVNYKDEFKSLTGTLDPFIFLKEILEISFKIKGFVVSNKKKISEIIELLKNYIEIVIIKNDVNLVDDNLFRKSQENIPQIQLGFKIIKTNSEFINIIKEFLLLIQNVNINHLNISIKGNLNNKQVDFDDLSDGEKEIVSITTIIESNLDYIENNLVIFDETFNTLHPNWQKKLLHYLIETFKNRKQNIHFILTTHSPFLLSDLPKENIIFLEKGEQVYPDINTFGANIHTLLSHGFFMKDGLIGEFAKSQIDDVINYLNNKKSEIKDNDKAQNIINLIGEPIIKRQLQKMLDSHRLSKVDKIDKIEQQINDLQNKLKEINHD